LPTVRWQVANPPLVTRPSSPYCQLVIDTDEKLTAWLAKTRDATWLALDTEADSLHAYPEKLCLIQISTAAGDDLIDPLAQINLEPLLQVLATHELIMHGSDYDLRLFRKHHEFVPQTIFDTMLAARLLGQRQFSLTDLVANQLGVTLEKGSQKADWARRPLTERMECYARNDTRHLKPLADRLRTELRDKGRLDWHRESCARLITDCGQAAMATTNSAWRIKGSNALNRPALAILREIWNWREMEAIAANRPPYFVLSHEALIQLASTAVASTAIEPLIPTRFSSRRRAGLRQAVDRGLALPEADQPEIHRPVRRQVSNEERRRYRELEKRRDAHATHLGLDPTLIASRATLAELAQSWEAHAPELMRWQKHLLELQPS
jgi:ribonuclease D